MKNTWTNHIWERLSRLTGLIVFAAIFITAYFIAGVEIKDLDLWLHLGAGKFITEHHYVPLTDVFSNSVFGKPWNNHEWLFQVLLYNVYRVGGMAGLSHMQVLMVLLTLSVLFFAGYSRKHQLLTCFFLLLVYLVFQQRFTIRPDLFSLFFFALDLYILGHHIDKRWSPYALLGIQILWTNMHGFFIFGPLLILIGLVAETVKRRLPLPYAWNTAGRLEDTEYRRLQKMLVYVLLACLVNPQFLKGALYPFKVLVSLSGSQSIFFHHIEELQLPISGGNIWNMDRFIYYKLLIILSLLSFVLNRRNIDLSALFLWIIFLVLSLKASRNIVYFAFAAYFVLIHNMFSVSLKEAIPLRFTAKKFQHMTEWMLKLCLLLWILNFSTRTAARHYYDFQKNQYKSEFGGVSLRSFPNRAVDFLVENNISGNFFNDFNSGAYLIGRTYPNIRVFMDGRTELYGAAFFKDVYNEMWSQGNTKLLDKNIRTYHLTGALLNSSRQLIPEKVLNYFYKNPDWVLVYFDYDGVIFLKKTKHNEPWIKKYALSLDQWQAPPVSLEKIGARETIPIEQIHRAYTLKDLGRYNLAEAEAKEALKISPLQADAYKILGEIYSKKGNDKTAYTYFRQAALLLPKDRRLRYHLGEELLKLGEYQEAVDFYEGLRQRWPKDPRAAFSLAKAYTYNRAFEDAARSLQEALHLDPKASADILEVGDVFYDLKEYSRAISLYQKALAVREDAQARYKLALSYKETGQPEKARQEAAKALAGDPENRDFQALVKTLN